MRTSAGLTRPSISRSRTRTFAVPALLAAVALGGVVPPLAAQLERGAPLKPEKPRPEHVVAPIQSPKQLSGDAMLQSWGRPINFAPRIYRGKTTVDFRWSGPDSATGVTLLRSAAKSGPFQPVPYASYADHWARDDGATVKQTQYYQLQATFPHPDGSRRSTSLSDIATVTIPAAPRGATSLQATSPGSGRVILNWTGDPEAIGYSIWRWNGTNREMMVDVGAFTTTFTDSGLGAGITFRYSVFGKYPDPDTNTMTDVTVTVH